MKIHCLTPFLDGTVRYEKDDQCTVPAADGARFCAAGWARDMSGDVATAEPVSGDVTLDIEGAGHGQASQTL